MKLILFQASPCRCIEHSPSRSCSVAHRGRSILNGTLAAALGLGLRLWLAGLLLGILGQAAAVWAAKRDPLFVDVVRRHLRIAGYLGV